jgi:predicted XRE-type DNA-binding protein
MMANERYTSVWDALVNSPEEAANLRLRSKLMREISRAVRSWELSQKEAAQRLNVTQPRLNDLLKGKIDKFSLDALVNMLAGANLELDVSVTVRETAAA